MELKDRLIFSRLGLAQKLPLFGPLIFKTRIIEDPAIGTQGVDIKGDLRYNPEWIKAKPINDLVFDFGHEIMHLARSAVARAPEGADPHLWNLAADFVADVALMDAGLPQSERSKSVVTAEAIALVRKLLTHEDIYKALKEAKKNSPILKGMGVCQSGHHSDKLSDSATTGVRTSLKAGLSMSRGDLPGLVEDFLLAYLRPPKADWKKLLRSAVDMSLRGKYTYGRLNRRNIDASFLPFPRRGPVIGGVVVAIDCSGSTQEFLESFMIEVEAISKTIECDGFFLMAHDVNVYQAEMIADFSSDKVRVTRGGTSHLDVFSVVERQHDTIKLPFTPKVIVCLTDLETKFPANCSVKTIWVAPESKVAPVPFGTIIPIS